MAPKAWRALVGRLGPAPPGTRLETMSVWDLAWSLVDYYDGDVEVSRTVDKTLLKDLGEPPLLTAVQAEGGADAVSALVLASRDPLRDLAWALLAAGTPESAPHAADAMQAIVTEFDDADARAKAEEDAAAPESADEPHEVEAERATKTMQREVSRAARARERALKRVDTMKDRLLELETAVATARRELRGSEDARRHLETERDRLARERDALRAQLQAGTAEVRSRPRLTGRARRRAAARARARGERARRALRESEGVTPRRPAARNFEGRPARGDGRRGQTRRHTSTAIWNLPIFSDEFYSRSGLLEPEG